MAERLLLTRSLSSQCVHFGVGFNVQHKLISPSVVCLVHVAKAPHIVHLCVYK